MQTDAEEENLVIKSFLCDIKRKVLRNKCPFLLHELLNDIISISEEAGFEEAAIKDTRARKRCIEEEFGQDILKYLVYASDTDPWNYSIANL